jgi:hypothetical protein
VFLEALWQGMSQFDFESFSFTPRFSEVTEDRKDQYEPFQRFTEKPLKRLRKKKDNSAQTPR